MHYAQDVPRPTDRALLVSVYASRGSHQVLVSQTMHVPTGTTQALTQVAESSPTGLRSMGTSGDRLKSLGLGAAQITTPSMWRSWTP